jgi:serine/threonine protein kinase
VHFGRLLGAVGFSRTVAIKRLHPHLVEDPEFTSSLIDEARLAARIHHPNVVPTLDVVATDGEVIVVMEYVRGESLARLLRAESTSRLHVPLPIASAIAIGALHGLHAAHGATGDRGAPLGIVHRDVSPQNILVGVDGLARIIDFGVAKAAGRLQTTREGVVKGKIAYMAPEQLDANEVTRAVDVYAMGVVLWEMLAGRRLFDAATQGELAARRVIEVSHDPPGRHAPNIPPALDALVMKALAKEASARFATAQEMADALQRIVPPAFPTDVGRWVQDVAGAALARRGEQLAEIESNSNVTQVPVSGPRPIVSRGAEVGALTVVQEPSSVSIETPSRSNPKSSNRAQRVALAAVLVTIVVTAGAAGLVWRMRKSATATATAGDGARQVASALPAEAPSSLPEPAPSASAAASSSASSSAVRTARSVQPTAPATTGTTPARVARPHGTPKPAPSILFAQPD